MKLTSDQGTIITLTILYFIQGLPLGLFIGAIPLVLMEQKATFSDLAVLSFVVYPFSLKILFAPIQDIFYSEKLGKRKSYIIPIQFILALCYFLLSFYINELIYGQHIVHITVIGFIFVSLVALQDVAVDGLVISNLSQENVGLGSSCEAFGQTLGQLTSSFLFIQLENFKLMSMSSFLVLNAVFIFVITFIIIFVNEKSATQQDNLSFGTMIEAVKCLPKNKHFRLYLFNDLAWRIGFQVVTASFVANLVSKGFDKSELQGLDCLVSPIQLLFPILIGKFINQGSEMKIFWLQYKLRFLDNILQVLILVYYNLYNDKNTTLTLVFFQMVTYSATNTVSFVNQGSFRNQICDEDLGATHLTFMNSISNLGGQMSTTICLFLTGILDYNFLVAISWTYCLLYYFFLKDKVMALQKVPLTEWKLVNHKYKQI